MPSQGRHARGQYRQGLDERPGDLGLSELARLFAARPCQQHGCQGAVRDVFDAGRAQAGHDVIVRRRLAERRGRQDERAHGRVRSRAAPRIAAEDQDKPAALLGVLNDRGRQPALADARFADHGNGATARVLAGQSVAHCVALALAADQRGAVVARTAVADARRAGRAAQAVSARVDLLQGLDVFERRELERRAAQFDGLRAHEDAVGRRYLLQGSGDVDGAADRIKSRSDLHIHASQADQAGMDADAEADRPIEHVANAAGLCAGMLDQPGRLAGAIGMVFHRGRPAEDGDAAVTRIVHHQPAGAPDRPVEVLVDAIQQFLGVVGIIAGDMAGGIDGIHRQHRHDAAFRRFRENPHRPFCP